VERTWKMHRTSRGDNSFVHPLEAAMKNRHFSHRPHPAVVVLIE